jgi:hypothetical protein
VQEEGRAAAVMNEPGYLPGMRRISPSKVTKRNADGDSLVASDHQPRRRQMELALAVLGAGPIGYFTATRRKGLLVYLGLWAVVFPIQCVVVSNTSGIDALYWVFNAAILAGGIGLNRLGSALRERHTAKQGVAAEAA